MLDTAEPDFDQFVIQETGADAAAIERAERASAARSVSLARAFVENGALSTERYAQLAAKHLGVRPVALSDLPESALFPDDLTPRFLTRMKCVPIATDEDTVTLATVDPFDETLHKSVALATAKQVLCAVIEESVWETALAQLYGDGHTTMGQLGEAFGPTSDDTAEDDDETSDAPVIQMVKLIVSRAIRFRASDIHLEPGENRVRVRFRIDGILVEQEPPPLAMLDALTSRLKIMASLNIAERRRPQDGRFTYTIDGRSVDLRMSIIPTVHGESIVLRVLDRASSVMDFEGMGFSPREIGLLEHAILQPNGMILTTGPTGSGKTTTLYASLLKLNSPERKIITIEDPVEYRLEGIDQIAINPRVDMTFARVLRNVLRQDPDIVMVGEMRDSETAEIAVRAAMTGHLVLSSAHTNTAIGAISRLRDMGLPPFLISATLSTVVAQRLVRRLCPSCAETRPLRKSEVELFEEPPAHLMTPRGCDACAGTGFSGRMGLYEILTITPQLSQLIANGRNANEIAFDAAQSGHKTLSKIGLEKVALGETTLEEIVRVVGSRDA